MQTNKKDKYVAGILEETSKFLSGGLNGLSAGTRLGGNISALTGQYVSEVIEDALQRGSKKLAQKAEKRLKQNEIDEDVSK